jgi:hypothetical protein
MFYREELLAKLEGHILSAVRDPLFSILAAMLHTLSQPVDVPCRGDKEYI